jgi:glycosyltransferase involved in cell wall biosynthesis
MRLVIDMQGAQTASRFRGIGRYVMALVQEMARQRGEHEMLLALNAAYADTIEPIRAAFADLLPLEAIRVFEVAGPVGGHDAANDARRKAAELIYEAYLASLNPDMILILSLFEEFGGAAVTSVHCLNNAFPTAVVFYDLIPLIHRKIYFSSNPAMERWYFGKIDHLMRADLLLSISGSSGREAKEHLNFPEHAVTNISTACDAQFQPIALNDAQRAHLKTVYGIDRPFVMNTGGVDHRKNLDGLFRAFGNLSIDTRKMYALVLVGREVADQKSHFLNLAKQAGLSEDELVFTGYVSDQDLALLYNACTLLVFPSWHEGFGLPVLEAMACGKAVIAANSSSLPEVVGRTDALFAPRDDAAMSAKMAEVLGNPEFRQELERHGLAQAKSFSWETSAQRAWQALETLHREHPKPQVILPLPKRSRLAFVSPLPPEKTGIADYAAELLPELARHYDITVVVQQEKVEDAWVHANASIRDVAWFRAHAQQFDRVLYQFGNSPFHSYMFELLADIPGTVVLHDFYLSWPVWHRDEHGPARHGWARALLAGHGWHAVRERLQAGKWENVVDVVTAYPCNLPVLQQAQGVIVHSDFSRRLAHQFYGDHAADDWALIPHLRQPTTPMSKNVARQQLGLAEIDFVVCSFGALDPTKLNYRLLDAWLASPLSQDASCRLVFVGENYGGDYGQDLLRKIAQSPAKNRITVTGWVDASAYRQWLSVADVGVQLRTLSRGGTSGTVLDCMNYSLPTIVNAQDSMADLPADTVWMLPDDFSDAQLVEALNCLLQDAPRRAELGACALAHIRTQHNPRRCADQYAAAIETAYTNADQGINGLIQALSRLTPPLAACEFPQIASTWAANFPPKPHKPQLLLDVSELVQRDARTGIQRVTRALLQEIILAAPKGWAVEPVYAVLGQPGYRYARKFMSQFLDIPDDWAEDAPVQAWQEDVFLGLDYQTDVVTAQENTFKAWHLRGIRVCFVVHDLMPVTMPEVFPEGTREGQQRWLQTISRFDGVLCVSRHVADEFHEWLQVFGEMRERPFVLHWFHHGADLDRSAPSLGMPSDAPQTLAALKARPTFLMVGTIEPRKGYLQTLRAFDALWAQGVDVNLVIVGKEGWMPLPDDQRRDIPQTVKALRKHAEIGKRLFWLEGISDEYLERVYAHATCLIGASYDEGFGLPLIEAARHGIPLMVRDIPVFREVTAGHAHYFADSPESLVIANAVQEWLTFFEKKAHLRSDAMPHQTWQDSAQQVLEAILQKTPAYKTWMPDGVHRYWGADPRLHTEVGRRRGKVMQTTGIGGCLIYGPYERIDAGSYRLIIQGMVKHWVGKEWIDIVSNNGKTTHFMADMIEASTGSWEAVIEFHISEEVSDIEVRLHVDEHSNLQIDCIEIQRLANRITLQQLKNQIFLPDPVPNDFVISIEYLYKKYRSNRGDCDSSSHKSYAAKIIVNSFKKPLEYNSYAYGERVFQYWDQAEIPHYINSSAESNKNLSNLYELFSNSSAQRFIKNNYDELFLNVFNLCWHPAMRADYFRLLKLYIDGGLYLDADDLLRLTPVLSEQTVGNNYLILMPLMGIHTPDGFKGLDLEQFCNYAIKEDEDLEKLACYFSNNYMMCNKFNPIIALCIYKATRDILCEDQSMLSIHGTTGPGLVSVATQVYAELVAKYGIPDCKVQTLDPSAIYFQADGDARRYSKHKYADWRLNNKPPSDFQELRVQVFNDYKWLLDISSG